MTADPLLQTKFHLPIAHGRLVPRARLDDQIGRAVAATLTLVSAPAGFGKTTVMTELASRSDGGPMAWLSLDPGDNDPVTFWTYVIAAIDRAAPDLVTGTRSGLTGAQISVDAVVTTLLNCLAVADADVVLLLDDLHVIDSPAIHAQLGYFLEHLPARAHVVIGTRADPAIPLARLRARLHAMVSG